MRRQGVAVRRQEPGERGNPKAVERLVGARVARSVPLKGPPQEANLQRKRLRTLAPKGAASELKKCTWAGARRISLIGVMRAAAAHF